MCSPRLSHSSSDIIQRKFGIRLWYFIKIVEFVLAGVCILLFVLNQTLMIIDDDFTPAYRNDSTKNREDPDNPSPEKNLSSVFWGPLRPPKKDSSTLLRLKRDKDRRTNPRLKLSYLLILYPCCTTLLIFFTMELLAQLFKDPLNKFSNLIIIALCVLLSISIFAESLICAIKTVHVNMILVAVLSAALILLVIIDFVLLVLSNQ